MSCHYLPNTIGLLPFVRKDHFILICLLHSCNFDSAQLFTIQKWYLRLAGLTCTELLCRNKDNCALREIDLHGLHTHEAIEKLHGLVEYSVKDPYAGAPLSFQTYGNERCLASEPGIGLCVLSSHCLSGRTRRCHFCMCNLPQHFLPNQSAAHFAKKDCTSTCPSI